MNWRDRSGLSLMELLIALALVAVISGLLASTTTFGVQLLDRTQTLQDTDPQLALRTRLRHWLGSAIPPSRLTGFPATLTGNAGEVTFTTLTPTPFAPQSAALRVTVDASGAELTMTVMALSDTGDVLTTWNRTLATDISDGKISYYATDPENSGWQDKWENTAQLPHLVRITTEDGSIPIWPEFTVKLVLAP